MARTYREIAIEEMLGTVEEAMSQVIDWWGDLPADPRGRRQRWPIRPWVRRSAGDKHELGQHLTSR
jgi:hypothetical protein